MFYKLFNETKNIEIDDNVIALYEKNVAPFNVKRAEYLAITSGLDETDNEKDIYMGIIEGIYEEVGVYKDKEQIMAKAREQGFIP